MTIVAHHHPFVIGADTHARSHAISILKSPTGELVDEAQFPATSAGLTRAITWAARRTGGDLAALWVVGVRPHVSLAVRPDVSLLQRGDHGMGGSGGVRNRSLRR